MRVSNVIGSQITSKRFTYSDKLRTFIGDMSEVSYGGFDPLGPLYRDACDQGFVMVSHQTNAQVEFYLDHIEREADGDIRFWLFKPTAVSISFNHTIADVKVQIVNT